MVVKLRYEEKSAKYKRQTKKIRRGKIEDAASEGMSTPVRCGGM